MSLIIEPDTDIFIEFFQNLIYTFLLGKISMDIFGTFNCFEKFNNIFCKETLRKIP